MTTAISMQDVAGLTRVLRARLTTRTPFSIDLPAEELAGGILASMRAQVDVRNGELKLTDELKSQIMKAAEWLRKPGVNFGLLLMGTPGNGKTTMMCAIGELINVVMDVREGGVRDAHRVPVYKAREIARMCASAETRQAYRRLFTLPQLAIDDLGEEPAEVMEFGRVFNPVEDLLSYRYDNQLMTLATTNLTSEAIKSKYGPRILDRLREMMRTIVFRNPSFRGAAPA